MSQISPSGGSRSPRYSAVAIGLHWAMAAALIGMIALGWNMSDLPDSDPLKKTLYQLHKSSGLAFFFLTLARLCWRLLNPPPPPLPMPDWQHRASEIVHWAFYALMLLMPLTGWILVSAAPISLPTVVFGIVGWPHIPGLADLDPATRKALFPIFENAHGKLAWLMLALVALHVGAALKHHFVDGDGLIARMAPKLFGPTLPPIRRARGALIAFGGSAALFAVIAAVGVLGSRGADTPHLIRVDGNWQVRMQDSSIGFSGTHAGKPFAGRFQSWQASIRVEPQNDAANAIEAGIDMSSARTGDSYYDQTLNSDDWFDTGSHRYAFFASSAMRAIGGDSYRVDGVLTFKGRDHPVSFPATVTIDGDSAEARFVLDLDRLDLGVGVSSDATGEWVGRTITVQGHLRTDRIVR